jgi:hypothetical protein
MHPPILAFGPLGGPEMFILLLLPLLYLVPIWLSFRKYGEGKGHWRMLSIVATLLFSWLGYIVIGSLHSGAKGYVEARVQRPAMKSCLGVLFTLLVLIAVIGGGAWLWYLSSTTQITRQPLPPAAQVPGQ